MSISQSNPGSPVLEKVRYFCSYRERCTAEVEEKLKRLKIPKSEWNWFLDRLKQEGFLNDDRYTSSFVSEKIRLSGWGKNKVRYALRKNRIPENRIEHYLKAVNEEVYRAQLEKTMKTYSQAMDFPFSFEDKQKLIRYATGKGYELEYILKALKSFST
mgnify:CR=1 FL=1